MTGIQWLAIGVAWISVGLFVAAALSGSRLHPEQRKREDDEQYRWICEITFIRRLDSAGERLGYRQAWSRALFAAKTNTRNIRQWSDRQLADANAALREYQ